MECLKNIIGLSEHDCECVDIAPSGFDTSDSGYYITDFDHGIPLLQTSYSISKCFGHSTVWEVMAKARELAVKQFCMELNKAIYKKNESRFKAFSGFIGKDEFSNSLNNRGKKWAGAIYKANNIKGGCWAIQAIEIGLDCSELIDVHIFDKSNISTPIKTIQIQSIVGQFVSVELDEELILSLSSDSCGHVEFLIAYELPSGCNPLNNKLTCCSDKPQWKNYFNVSGFCADDLTNLKTNSWAQGLRVGGYLKCNGLEWLCEIGNINGYEMSDVVAKTIQYLSSIKLAQAVLDTGEINHFVNCSRESLYGKRNHFKKEAFQNIQWICENIPKGCTDCFKCKTRGYKARL